MNLGQSYVEEKFVWWWVVVGGGAWLRVNLVLRFDPNLRLWLLDLDLDQAEQLSDHLLLSLSLALPKPNKRIYLQYQHFFVLPQLNK